VGAVGAYVVLSTSSAPAAASVLAMAVIGAVVLGAAGIAIGRIELALWATGGLAAAYVGSLLYRAAPPDPRSALVVVALLLSSELASWSIDSRRRAADDIVVHIGRLRSIALEITAALALVLVVETANGFGAGGTASAAIATAAVLLGTAAICLLMWRSAQVSR